VLLKRRKVPRVSLASYVVEKEEESDSLETKRERNNEEMNVDRKAKPGETMSLTIEQSLQGRVEVLRNESG
jgi:cell division protein FtsI/penicillin-binding protein 2